MGSENVMPWYNGMASGFGNGVLKLVTALLIFLVGWLVAWSLCRVAKGPRP